MNLSMKTRLRYTRTALTVVMVAIIISLSGPLVSLHAAGLSVVGTRSTDQIQSFQPNGQGFVVPQRVSTLTTPQVNGTGSGSVVDLPGPGGHVNVPSPQNVVHLSAPGDPHLATQVKFEGETQHGWEPSDSNGAGGVSNYIEVVNEQWAVYSRAGARLFGTTFDAWFRFPTGTSLFDPVVQWDKTGGRFIFVVDSGSSLLLSVARQSSALGNYCNYTIATPSGYFADYEKLGVDADGVYISVNLYS